MKPLALILTLLLALVGCAEKGQAYDPAHNQVKEEDGVKLSATLDRASYGPRDDIHVHVEATNEGSERVNFVGYNGCDPGINVSTAGYLRVKKVGEPNICTEALVPKTLNVHDTLAVDFVLRPQKSAPSGTHTLLAVFQRGKREEHVKLEVPFTVQ
ncbi:hypothetical protein JJB07_09995 [Tumebacillus sp. ITR2]|uniref:Intracellular proteinase inhibitor BsuPI domain-containing protein n=1 Tax=Tumebacillus amylolyticus TaxID=2801339 RepID=A0ABS1J9N7_9BACL|nr:hypothetical protein [Tumebacillus amylolyticus]MBL0386986.1 hypothetical protein [Tumebacillus amylolyticus]